MSRLFWIALGATAGVLIVRKLSRTAEAYTPAGLARGLQELGGAIRDFAEDVRAATAERELELNHALGLDERLENPVPGER